MPPVPPSRKKQEKKPGYTANQLLGAVLIGTFSIIALSLFPDLSENAAYDSFTSSAGIKRGRVETVCEGYGDARVCSLRAARNINAGEKVITMPTKNMIQAQDILQDAQFKDLLAYDNEGLKSALADNGVSEAFYQTFVVVFKIWHEKKIGSSSAIASWLDLLPSKPDHAIFFTDEETTCLDRLSFDDRNATITMVKGMAGAVEQLCKGADLYSCRYATADTITEEVMWAFATISQRGWGELTAPMMIPMVDLALSHPGLCNPAVDKDESCFNKDRQHFLQPEQDPENKDIIYFRARNSLLKGEPIFATYTMRAPWEVLTMYGYVDYATDSFPDLEFRARFNKFAQENRIDTNSLAKDHPLKVCTQSYRMGWGSSGMPKKELRDCWSNMFYFTENPDALVFDEEAQAAYDEWKADEVAQLKSKFLSWRHTHAAAKNVGSILSQPAAQHCSEKSGRLEVIAASRELVNKIYNRILTTSTKKEAAAFAKWKAADETADAEVPEPQAPVKEEVELEGGSADITIEDENQ